MRATERMAAVPIGKGGGPEGLGEGCAGLGAAVPAGFDLRVGVTQHLLEDHVDPRVPFVTARAYVAQVFPAVLGGADFRDRNGPRV